MSGKVGLGVAWPLCLAGLCLRTAAAQPTYDPPMERFVTHRPRLFIHAESLSTVTQAADRAHGAWLNGVRDQVSRLAANTNLPAGDYGVESAAAAFFFLCERTPERLNVATGLLERSVGYYRACDLESRVVSHYSATRIHAITAYDWLYDAMPPDARLRLGRELLAHVARRVTPPRVAAGDNLDGFPSGFYGELSLPWYVGIATRGTGSDEEKSAAAIAFGYDQHMRMLEHRRRLAGDDGGGATATLGYTLGADPWAEWNFFHTMESAFALPVATNWPHAALLPNYVLWNRLPGHLEFGAGDAFHMTNELPDQDLYTHLAQIRHFYGRSQPVQAALAAWLQGQCRRPFYSLAWPLTPFLLTELDRSPPPREPPNAPFARHFEGMGQFFMRSGWGADDTYALFTAGGSCDRHKHFDENTFVIFRQGFLALDSGTRPEPGSHLFQYYCRTVAHNGVLIRMEGETLPYYWGTPAPGEPALPAANDGGMRSPTGAVIRAFHTTPDYTYIASDATGCYHPGKCRLAVRQFMHIQPDRFVIFDRVTAVEPDYPKTWLLHTANEPRVEGDRWVADHGAGRLWGRTLLPRDAALTTVGGDGREFWNDGRNWPIPDGSLPGDPAPGMTDTMGRWRVEVSPPAAAREDVFLHVLQAGDGRAGSEMTPVRLLEDGDWAGVEFEQQGCVVRAEFRTKGDLLARIRIEGEGRLLNNTLNNTIQPQSGLTLVGPAAPTELRTDGAE